MRACMDSVGAMSDCMAPRSWVETSAALPVTPENVAMKPKSSSRLTPIDAAMGVTRPMEAASSGKVV